MQANTASIFAVHLLLNPMDKTRTCTIGGAGGVGLLGLLCPLCIPAVAAFLSSIGLGFIATKEVIWPLLGFFFLLFLYGLAKGYKQHNKAWPLVIGVLGLVAVSLGNYVIGSSVLTYGGVAAAVGAAFWNIILRKRCKHCA